MRYIKDYIARLGFTSYNEPYANVEKIIIGDTDTNIDETVTLGECIGERPLGIGATLFCIPDLNTDWYSWLLDDELNLIVTFERDNSITIGIKGCAPEKVLLSYDWVENHNRIRLRVANTIVVEVQIGSEWKTIFELLSIDENNNARINSLVCAYRLRQYNLNALGRCEKDYIIDDFYMPIDASDDYFVVRPMVMIQHNVNTNNHRYFLCLCFLMGTTYSVDINPLKIIGKEVTQEYPNLVPGYKVYYSHCAIYELLDGVELIKDGYTLKFRYKDRVYLLQFKQPIQSYNRTVSVGAVETKDDLSTSRVFGCINGDEYIKALRVYTSEYCSKTRIVSDLFNGSLSDFDAYEELEPILLGTSYSCSFITIQDDVYLRIYDKNKPYTDIAHLKLFGTSMLGFKSQAALCRYKDGSGYRLGLVSRTEDKAGDCYVVRLDIPTVSNIVAYFKIPSYKVKWRKGKNVSG